MGRGGLVIDVIFVDIEKKLSYLFICPATSLFQIFDRYREMPSLQIPVSLILSLRKKNPCF